MKQVITNSTEFDYKLSGFAAAMLMDGICDHLDMIKKQYRAKEEDTDYCHMILWTVRKETLRLLNLLETIDSPHIVEGKIHSLKYLLGEIDKFYIDEVFPNEKKVENEKI